MSQMIMKYRWLEEIEREKTQNDRAATGNCYFKYSAENGSEYCTIVRNLQD